MTPLDFARLFRNQIPFELTGSQRTAGRALTNFICNPDENQVFILNGYAGTGKTTMVSALVKTLTMVRKRCVLLAPTGRSAKVFSVYSGRKAYTIHKCLYWASERDGIREFTRRPNKATNTVFIVDEASMIGDGAGESPLFGSRSLMDDLFSFVFEGANCQLLLVGDNAQLPPVNFDESPALEIEYIRHNFNVTANSTTLTDVTRQTQDSGILHNASLLRHKMQHDDFSLPIFAAPVFPDCKRVNGEELEELLNHLYGKYESDEIVTITYSNKRAYVYNQEIRHRILYREEQLSAGDFVIAVKNNYFWVQEDDEVGFIANGDNMEILSINKTQDIYGFRFADVTARLCDYPDHDSIDIKIILDSLDCEGPALGREDWNRLYESVSQDYADIPTKKERYQKMREDPFLNAVQVKFSYALTCHKTQGGQWLVVLLDQGIIQDGILTKSYFRWLYTALTRATKQVYLINFNNSFFDIES